MSQLIHIEAIEKRLGNTAETLREREEMGIVGEITGRQRNRLYAARLANELAGRESEAVRVYWAHQVEKAQYEAQRAERQRL